MNITLDSLIAHAESSLIKADKCESKLTNDILNMDGMSGSKTRHFYNNICDLPEANYLEIGSWKGSSFASALFKNKINAITIDNWSEFGNQRTIFENNIKRLCPGQGYKFFEKDCFSIDKSEIPEGIDIYLYDGQHTFESQRKAITHYAPFLSKFSIIIIDDWRTKFDYVLEGTYKGLEESGLIIHKKIERISCQELGGEYWNGLGLFICEKSY